MRRETRYVSDDDERMREGSGARERVGGGAHSEEGGHGVWASAAADNPVSTLTELHIPFWVKSRIFGSDSSME